MSNETNTETLPNNVKRVKINPFLDNFGVFNWTFWGFSLVSSSFAIMSFILFFILFFEEGKNTYMNYYETLGAIEIIVVKLITYIATSVLSIINGLNYINDLLSFFNISNEKIFNFDAKIISPNLSFQGWIVIFISIFLGFKFQFFTIYQKFFQEDFNHTGFQNYYVPFIFLFKNYNREKNKRLYLRLLDVVKLEKFNPNNKSEEQNVKNILQFFFNIPLEECEKYKIQIRSKKLLFKIFYNYQIWEVIEIKKEGKKDLLVEQKDIDIISDKDDKLESLESEIEEELEL